MKIFRLALATLLLSTCVAVSANAENMFSQQDLQRYENNIGFLSEIGVMEYSDNITRTVTRGEFAKILNALNGVYDLSQGSKVFTDVSEDNEYAAYINNAYVIGVMNGYGGGLFGPDDSLTYEQAVYGLVRILGYGGLIESGISSYSQVANELDLYDSTYGGINYPITYGSLSIMIMNTLEAEVMEYDMNNKVASGSGKTLSETVFDIVKYTGIVTATEKTSLTDAEGVGKNVVEFDNEVYYSEIRADELLGYRVDYYIDTEEDEAVYFCKSLSKNEELIINAEQIDGYKNRIYTYINEYGRVKTEKVPSGCAVIYNGRAITNESEIDMAIKNGKLTFIDNNGDNDWEVLKIEDIKSMVVGVLNSEEYTIRDKFESSNILDLKKAYNNGWLTIKNYQGLDSKIEDITDGQVASVIMSADNQMAEIYLSRTKKSGQIEMYYPDERIQIGGEEFKLRVGELSGDIQLNGSGTLYVDTFGYGVYFERTGSGLSYGYVTGMFQDPGYNTYGIKVYDFDTETVKILYLDKKVVTDGSSKKDNEALNGLKEGGSLKPQIMGYKLNGDGKINKIDTLEYNRGAEPEETLRLHTTSTSGVGYRSEMSCFRDGKTFSNASTKFVKIPLDGENMRAEDFLVFSSNDLSNDGQYKFTSYQVGENKLSADFVLMTTIDNLTIFGVVKDTLLCVDNNGEEAYKIELYNQSGNVETVYAERDYIEKAPAYNTGSGAYRIDKGDVISYLTITDISGTKRIHDAEIVFDYDEKGESKYLAGANPYTEWGKAGVNFYCGNVYSREGNIIGMTDESLDSDNIEYTADELQIMSLDRGTVFKMQEGKVNEVVKGKASEIVDYKSAGEDHSKIFVYLASLVVRIIYIYD